MSSTVSGYKYDIFISYRQKDNKGDGWVSEFVEALKTELESTFKEEISVYFDINPHDGLLETYDVDESLKEKLKCLIFIPIISRTYCDPKAFAWEHEFKAFIEQASNDQFGLKVRLPNGNVASRVLPVQIHELDVEDRKLVEDELSGYMRGVEFIYKSPGINRPLLPQEENPHNNLNHTNYRDQINKVANTVKEIISGFKKYDEKSIKDAEEKTKVSNEPKQTKSNHLNINKRVLLILLIVLFGTILFFTINRIYQVRLRKQVYTEIIPQIDSLINTYDFLSDNYWTAFILLNDAEGSIPKDSNLINLENRLTMSKTILSDPPGASVYGKSYMGSDTSWHYFGLTPIENCKIPMGSSTLKIVKEGYQNHTDAFNLQFITEFVFDTIQYKLKKENDVNENMTLIAGQKIRPNLNGIQNLESQFIGDFYIDKYEVTNKEYQKFIENGGYRNPSFWKHNFVKDGVLLDWDTGISYFKDQTGNYGPAYWNSAMFPSGEEQYPVSGISWYEAAAYAEYSAKSLPTLYHYSAVIDRFLIPDQIKYSNFNGKYITPVGTSKGISRHGIFDVVGNVREWIYNQQNNRNYIFGGGAKDPTYYSIEAYATNPWQRDEFNGFRCIKYVSDTAMTILEKSINYTPVDRSHDKPVSDNEFRLLKSRYEYDKTPVEVKSTVNEIFEGWNKKIVTIASVYGGPDLNIHVYLPNNVSPPYQSVILFPGINAMLEPPTYINNYPESYEFILRSGRAIILPRYFNTYGRGTNFSPALQEYIENCIKRIKDLQRTIDYMESSPDIYDTTKIAYFGISWGSHHSPWALAIEKRIKLGVVNAFGLDGNSNYPILYHLNYLPRVTIPMLMFSGKYDYAWSFERQRLFVEYLGTPDKEKKWISSETVHGVSGNEIQRELIPWLDRHFGSALNK